jgi:Zn-dependent metalloprotease
MSMERGIYRRAYAYRGIIPSEMLKAIAKNSSGREQDAALHSLSLSSFIRGKRTVVGKIAIATAVPAGQLRRTVYDMNNDGNMDDLPGKLVRGENDPESGDIAVSQAFDGAGATYKFYKEVFDRNGIDNNGMRMDSSVHFDTDYDNAFWDGKQMVYGDGDGSVFQKGCFTSCLDVIGHEITHGVTQYESNLLYQGQSGALNESFSDVMGIQVKQYALGQTVEQADWLIGKGMFGSDFKGLALRSMKEPGTAYDDARLGGKDPQPATMKDYVRTSQDNGGVHLNSGIPNHAFYLAAAKLGGYSWQKAGKIWYNSFLHGRVRASASFEDAANITSQVARELFGAGSSEQKAVIDSWAEVGITTKK